MTQALRLPRSIYQRAVLLDTAAWVAIPDETEQYHRQAIRCLHQLRELAFPLYVTVGTIAETHRQVLYRPHLGHTHARRFQESIYEGSVNILSPTKQDKQQATVRIDTCKDQTITFTDAINMAIVGRKGLGKVFSFDRHFRLLAFQTILPLEL